MTAPKIVFSILEKLDIGTAEYIFIIATRYHHPEISLDDIALQRLELADGKVEE
jgi:hypothetical protein